MTEGGKCILLCLNNHVKGLPHSPAHTDTEVVTWKRHFIPVLSVKARNANWQKRKKTQNVFLYTHVCTSIYVRTVLHSFTLILSITAKLISLTLTLILTLTSKSNTVLWSCEAKNVLTVLVKMCVLVPTRTQTHGYYVLRHTKTHPALLQKLLTQAMLNVSVQEPLGN